MTRTDIDTKAKQLWDVMDQSEKHGIRFGLFPHHKLSEAEKAGFDPHQLSIALMECASRDGGMRG